MFSNSELVLALLIFTLLYLHFSCLFMGIYFHFSHLFFINLYFEMLLNLINDRAVNSFNLKKDTAKSFGKRSRQQRIA